MKDFKPRDQHVGAATEYLGQSHREKDGIEKAALAADQGPTFGTPGSPPETDPEAIADMFSEATDDGIGREAGVTRSG